MKELSLNVLDIVLNSVKAEASLVTIEILEREMLEITIADNGCGMAPEFLARVIDPFTTTRTTRKVGLGIPLFKLAAEMAGGTFRIESEEGVGTTVCATFDPRNIDCPTWGHGGHDGDADLGLSGNGFSLPPRGGRGGVFGGYPAAAGDHGRNPALVL